MPPQNQLIHGHCNLALGGILQASLYPNDIGPALSVLEVGVVLRNPAPVDSFFKLTRIFDRETWIVLGCAFGAFAVFFVMAMEVYEWTGEPGLVSGDVTRLDLLFVTVVGLTEPQPIRCFKRASSLLLASTTMSMQSANSKQSTCRLFRCRWAHG